MKTKRIKVPVGWFEFTVPQKKRDELNGWQVWFDQKGIKNKVVETPNGSWTLIREGEEAK